ncbi:MAG: TonB-dependent receptor [Bacteroidales bacterium]|nr:TonB-dependent receptor [Bacteroidales bacterium]
MVKKQILFTLFALLSFTVSAENTLSTVSPDSIKYSIDLDEVEIVSNPKTNTPLQYFPGSVSLLDAKELEKNNVVSIKDLSSYVPNLYIPDYGSKLISAMYIRGIGSRINSPAVGLYVDDVPYLDKSSFDFNFSDISKVEVFRGPQGTLFGRNTMAGLINVYTVSPFDDEGLKVKLGSGNYDSYNAMLGYRKKISDKFAFSLSANVDAHDGYFVNEFTNETCGDEDVAGANVRLQFRPNSSLDISLASRYEYSNQNGYPYRKYNKLTQEVSPINYNNYSGYKRNMSVTSLKVAYTHKNFILNSVTSYQFLTDDMNLDQDFTTVRDFTLQQKQKQNSVTHEIVVKSPRTKRGWDWLAGVYGYYSHIRTNGPVTFYDEGLQYMVETPFNTMYAQIASRPGFGGPKDLTLQLDKSTPLCVDGLYKTPSWGVAGYSQATYNNLFTEGLSLTVGMRLEYEKTKLSHKTESLRNMTGAIVGSMQVPGMPFSVPINEARNVPLSVSGNESMDALEFLPRFEIEYKILPTLFAYASVAKGYRSGGYNFQAFSNIIRNEMIMGAIGSYSSMLPESMQQSSDVNAMISYAPEHSWNYEAGMHYDNSEKRVGVDLALFFIDCKDQQISVVEGFGRVTKNSGRTHSTGVETSLRYSPIKSLALSASYGYTHAVFRENYDGERSYANNFVPFAPAHTLALDATYTLDINKKWLDAIDFNVGMTGQGRIYWTEANDVWQNFYALLNSNITLRAGNASLSIWGKNLTVTNYNVFYFETLNAKDVMSQSSFVERGRPITFGVDVVVRF